MLHFFLKPSLIEMPSKKMSHWGGRGVWTSKFHIFTSLKSNSSHSESFWKKNLGENWGGTPILSHFSPILAIPKILTSVLTFQGAKNFFYKSAPSVP